MHITAKEIIAELTGSYKLEGRMLTPKRKVVVSFLCEQTVAIDAESLWLTLRSRGRKVSIASFYLTVNWLARKGYVKRFFDPEMHQNLYLIES